MNRSQIDKTLDEVLNLSERTVRRYVRHGYRTPRDAQLKVGPRGGIYWDNRDGDEELIGRTDPVGDDRQVGTPDPVGPGPLESAMTPRAPKTLTSQPRPVNARPQGPSRVMQPGGYKMELPAPHSQKFDVGPPFWRA